ncbi:uncharacterized protein TNCT_655541 [Trichonephila clavata]|uniref:Uncharacterized protein n=1 Tax=Trichonephila clavata TaxID=2740835 RepID=A0A8X6KTH7_TRICU|nr:uncharacterized protein TNCT_655541 [Trichonephila clavata]
MGLHCAVVTSPFLSFTLSTIFQNPSFPYVQELTIQKVETCEYDRVFHVITTSQGNGMFWKLWTLECCYDAHLLCQIVLLNVFFHRLWSLSSWSWSAIPILFPDMGTCIHDYFSGGGQTTGRFRCLYYP